jgi:hypothetical protein
MLTLLTATGGRPHAWAICEKLMAAQTYTGQVRWVIVDDGEKEQPIKFKPNNGLWHIEIYRPEPFWQPGQNTQARNLLTGLAVISSDENLVIIEDDDFYAPDWLETVEQKLKKAELVGETRARYYNVQNKTGREMLNESHASLCATAMRGQAIDTFRSVCRPGIQFIDHILWQAHSNRHLFDGHRVVGIKGLPGRQGIGMGHDKKFSGTRDNGGKLLTEWVGQDAVGLYIEEQVKWPKPSEK